MFIDSAKIHVKAGDGGNGIVSFHREKYIAAGGPDGGDGGRGGDVVFVVDGSIRTLADFRYKRKYEADSGKHGGACNCTGRSADDLIIKVPQGTVIKDGGTGRVIADMVEPGQTFIVAKGGKGGAGNQHFATSTRQVPNFAKSGDPGEERWVLFELKLLADVGLIGYPNVGKSTILSMVSAAKPKIADYHFTTLNPNLGVVSIDTGNSFVIADIPGLIEGAHEGLGLGHEFLKHIERTRLLVHVVDVAGIEERDPLEDFEVINRELREFNPKLAERPQVVAANKTDIPGSMEKYRHFRAELEKQGYKVFPVSAASNKGLRELILHVAERLQELPQTHLHEAAEEEVVYSFTDDKQYEIRKEDGVYIIEGNWAKKLVNSTNFTSYDSLQYFQRTIKKVGINDELERMGIQEGNTVKIDKVEFEYVR